MQVAAESLCRSFAGRAILSEVSCQVSGGMSLAVIGPSGCGKSTLLQLLAGLDKPERGRVLWDDIDISKAGRRRRDSLRRQYLGLVRQDPCLDPYLSARNNCLLPATFRSIPSAEQRADTLLSAFALDDAKHVPGGSLSGGQQVRCALARALLKGPQVLIADEPTGTLDAQTAGQIAEALLDRVQRENIALVLATHDNDLAARCDQVLDLGQVLAT